MAIKVLVFMMFVPPMILGCALFVHEAIRMERMAAYRAHIRREARRARCYDAMQRKVRGTPSKRPGQLCIR
jgi:hypothetical protein